MGRGWLSEGMSVIILTHTHADGHTQTRRCQTHAETHKHTPTLIHRHTHTQTSSEKSEKRTTYKESMHSANQDFLRKCYLKDITIIA